MEFSFDHKSKYSFQRHQILPKKRLSALKLLHSTNSFKQRQFYLDKFDLSVEIFNSKFNNQQTLFEPISEKNNLFLSKSVPLQPNSSIELFNNNKLYFKTFKNKFLKNSNLNTQISKSLWELSSNNFLTKKLHSSRVQLNRSESLNFNSSKNFLMSNLTLDKKSKNFEKFSALATNLATINAMNADMAGILGRLRFDVKGFNLFLF